MTKDDLYQKYIVENMSRKECATFFNVSESKIKRKVLEYNLLKTKEQLNEIISKSQKQYIDKDVLLELYVNKNLSMSEIASKLNVSFCVVKRRLKEYEIKKPAEKFKEIHKTHFNVDENVNEKRKQTVLNKYGVDNVSKIKYIKDKKTQTCLNKYGVSNGSKKNFSKLFISLQENENKSKEFFTCHNQEFTIDELCNYLGISYLTASDWLNKFNLKQFVKHIPTKNEDEVVNFIISLGIDNIIRRTRNVLPDGKELDVFLPNFNIAIEVNGTYWHSEIEKNKKYHFNKSLECEKLGIRLIHIWQYEWEDSAQKEKIKMLLKIALGKVDNKIYARQCEIKEITNKDAKMLNEKVHLQGHRNAQVTYGLFFKDELVQLMSFSKTKYNRNLKSDNSWEIIRGCPGSNNIVIGGVSKLFKHFIKSQCPDYIFSYCDFNKFNGKSYEAIGMKFVGYTEPDMKYVLKNGDVVNRDPFNYKNNKENMKWRLYGAGSKKYVWTR